jgi:4-alpha-glucanotransferase
VQTTDAVIFRSDQQWNAIEMDDNRNAAEYRWQEFAPDTPKAIVDALQMPAAAFIPGDGEPVHVVSAGTPLPWPHEGTLLLEDARTVRVAGWLPGDLPLGYHEFFPDHQRWKTRVIVTPAQCVVPARLKWGWAAQLYATRSAESWGIGDLADLRRLASWASGVNADLVMINPLCAVAPGLPQPDSPYYPSSRLFRNPLYLRVEETPGAELLGPQLQQLAAAGRALNERRHIDRDAVFRLKQEALKAIWAGFSTDPAFDDYCREQSTALEQFAVYCVLAEQFGDDWRTWPAEYRDPRGPAVHDFAKEHPAQIRYHQWLQWLLDEQLARAAEVLPIVQDLPIGFNPGGADAWIWQDLLATQCSVGAPPDAFNPAGQDWDLPPLVPWKLRAAAYEPFIQTIRASLRHASGLRIDHVMGLFRLYWIPKGHSPADGTYVRYPADDLMGIVALESHRRGAFVIGEDLGTVEPGVRERLAQRQILSFRVLWFEPERPPEYPYLAMATATTHDLPTIAGLWTGSDAAAQQALGLPVNDELAKLRRHYDELITLAADAPIDRVIEATYGLLGESPSAILLANLDDALAVPDRPNLPGTTTEWPNWRLALPGGLEALEAAELPRRIAKVLERRG